MFKLQEYVGNLINKFLEWTWQRKANRQFKNKK